MRLARSLRLPGGKSPRREGGVRRRDDALRVDERILKRGVSTESGTATKRGKKGGQ